MIVNKLQFIFVDCVEAFVMNIAANFQVLLFVYFLYLCTLLSSSLLNIISTITGVLWNSLGLIPGAVETVNKIKEMVCNGFYNCE